MYEKEKYKSKITSIIEQRGLYSVMNNTKWAELKTGIQTLPFAPPFVIKRVDEEKSVYHEFDENAYYLGDWGDGLDCFLGSDIYATPFFAIEWIKVRPCYLKMQGWLIPPEVLDETEEFITILKSNHIPYEERQGVFMIFGYR